MCKSVFADAFFKTRNGSVVFVTKGPGETLIGRIVQAPEATRRQFPTGTKVVYQNSMGHVLCKGEEEGGKECALHGLDAVDFKTTGGGKWDKLLAKAKEPRNGGAVMVVMADEERAKEPKVETVDTSAKANGRVLFKDLKAGQKFKHDSEGATFVRTNKKWIKDLPGYDQFGVTEDLQGKKYWTSLDAEVFLVS